jgi:hypothetical protein
VEGQRSYPSPADAAFVNVNQDGLLRERRRSVARVECGTDLTFTFSGLRASIVGFRLGWIRAPGFLLGSVWLPDSPVLVSLDLPPPKPKPSGAGHQADTLQPRKLFLDSSGQLAPIPHLQPNNLNFAMCHIFDALEHTLEHCFPFFGRLDFSSMSIS